MRFLTSRFEDLCRLRERDFIAYEVIQIVSSCVRDERRGVLLMMESICLSSNFSYKSFKPSKPNLVNEGLVEAHRQERGKAGGKVVLREI